MFINLPERQILSLSLSVCPSLCLCVCNSHLLQSGTLLQTAFRSFTIRSSGNITAKLDWLLCSQSCPCPQQLWKEERDDQMTSSFDMLLLKRKVRLGWVNLC